MPEHPRMVKPVTFRVHIVDGAGKPVDNARVKGSLTMKVMDMGKTELTFEPKGNGNYEGTLKEHGHVGSVGPCHRCIAGRLSRAEDV